MRENRPFRLSKPIKGGLLRLVFSRFLLILLLLLLQVGLVVAFYFFLEEYFPYFSVAMTGFTIFMVIYLFNCPMDPDSKLTWMLLISILPVGASFLFLFTRANAGHNWIKKRCMELIHATKTSIPQPEGVLPELEQDDLGTEDLVHYLNRSGCFPAYKNTETAYLPSGEDFFAALLSELDKAEHFIFMEFFILEEGVMWGSVLRKLIEKAEAGVEVRVLYDGMCEMKQLPFAYHKILRQHGIKAKVFAPIRPMISSHYNYRDHRKIVVIDGQTAFTGGANLADEYINRDSRFGHWKDAALCLRGEAVRSFTLLFLQMWNIDEPMPAFAPYINVPAHSREASGYVIPYGDNPLDGDRVGETVYMDILQRSNDYVHIMTPYLILDGRLRYALQYAAERGVDVKLILPGVPDKKLAYALAKSHYRELMASGVQIFEYIPGFVHAKVVVSDDCKAVVGTINMDYRSLYHHFECAAYLYRTDSVFAAEADFQKTLGKCRRVTAESMKEERLYYRLMGPLIKFLAPLM